MGAWGPGIKQDDLVCDVIAAFDELLKQGKSLAAATSEVTETFRESIGDRDDGPVFWIGVAEAQWTYGKLEQAVLRHVRDDLDSGRSLARWDEDARALSKRRAVLQKFLDKLAKANPRPKKPAKVVVRPPKFQTGDCLSVLLENQQYGAVIVVATDHSDPEYGLDLIASLNYMSPEKPALGTFEKRKWLYLTHGSWNNRLDLHWFADVGFRKMKPRLEVIGRIHIRRSDPQPAQHGITYSGWQNLGRQIILQHEHERRPK